MQTQGSLNITDAQQDVATVVFEDAGGNVVPIVGIPVWVSSDTTGAVVTVTPAADGMTAVFVGIAPGSASVSVTGEGDAVAGKDTVSVSFTVTVTADEASQAFVTFGTPTQKS